MCVIQSADLWTGVFVQVYSQLPLQRLSGYTYEVEDFEPYPCFPLPMPETEPEPEPEIEVDVPAARRGTRSVYFGQSNQKDDVYSIFKVENWIISIGYKRTEYRRYWH